MPTREKDLKGLMIATINTLFDGVGVENRSIESWVVLHAKTYARRGRYVQREQRLRNAEHPIEQIIKRYEPQVLVANEVIQAPWGSETIILLDKYNYPYRAIGSPEKPKDSLAQNTLIASRLPGTSVDVTVSNPTGGHFCALRIDDSDILIVGIQASAFFSKIRFQQINEVFAFCNQKVQEGLRVIVAGDFNCELTEDDGIKIPGELAHLTTPSFPHPNLVKRINRSSRIPRRLFQSLLSLSGDKLRSLDHILIPSDWTVLSIDSEVTSSDHLGLIAKIDFS